MIDKFLTTLIKTWHCVASVHRQLFIILITYQHGRGTINLENLVFLKHCKVIF